MSTRKLSTDRFGALEATKHFPPETIGYGVHQGIDLLYNGTNLVNIWGVPISIGPLYNLYSADVGTLFQRADMQKLMALPATNREAQLKVARKEREYWQKVLEDPNSSWSDRQGAEIAMALSEKSRADFQEAFADGRDIGEVVDVVKELGQELDVDTLALVMSTGLITTDLNLSPGVFIARLILDATRRLFDPLVLDLDGNGVELVSVDESTAQFDLDADGFREQTGWVSATDGMLALDANNDGVINNINELFGDATTDGFDELKLLDSNGDGVINRQDENFADLKVWQDINQDGRTDSGELRTISRAGIKAISLDTTVVDKTHKGNQVRSTSTFSFSNGTQNEVASVWYAVDRVNSSYDKPYELDLATVFLPTLRGYGRLPDLHISMSLDSDLLSLVENSSISDNLDLKSAASETQNIMLAWAGVEETEAQAGSEFFDSRKSAFLGKLIQQPVADRFRNPRQTTFIGRSWNTAVREMSVRLLVQGAMNKYFVGSTYNLGSDTLHTDDSLGSTLKRLRADAPSSYSESLLYWSYAVLILDAHEGSFGLEEQAYNKQISDVLSRHGLSGNLDALRNPFYGSRSNEYLYGDSQQDLFFSSEGNDYFSGDRGDDIYLYSAGDGNDTIEDDYYGTRDQLVLSGRQLTEDNAVVSRVGNTNDLLISFGRKNTIRLKDQIYSTSRNYGIEKVTFSDGKTWNETQLWGAYLGEGARTNDVLKGTDSSDTIVGGKGNDYLIGNKGNDTYHYSTGDGNDTIEDDYYGTRDQLVLSGRQLTEDNAVVSRVGNTNDLLISFGRKNTIRLKDQIYSTSRNYGIEKVTFSDGKTWNETQLWGAYLGEGARTNDVLKGTDSSDTIVGGKGNDYLIGNKGNDTYHYSTGDGNDTIEDDYYGTNDRLIFFGDELVEDNAIVSRVGNTNDLLISFGRKNTIRLKDQIYSTSRNYGIEKVTFSDGKTWNETQLWGAYLGEGARTNDVLKGTDSSDTIVGGKGNDYLIGNKGNDTYHYSTGDGNDTIEDDYYGTNDRLIFFGDELVEDNAIVSRVDGTSDLLISFGSINGSVRLKDQIYSTSRNYGIEGVTFSDGTTWNETQLWDKAGI